jgi:hypothetical protein
MILYRRRPVAGGEGVGSRVLPNEARSAVLVAFSACYAAMTGLAKGLPQPTTRPSIGYFGSV